MMMIAAATTTTTGIKEPKEKAQETHKDVVTHIHTHRKPLRTKAETIIYKQNIYKGRCTKAQTKHHGTRQINRHLPKIQLSEYLAGIYCWAWACP